MPAGFKYDLNSKDTLHEFCRYDTVYRLSGGFNLVTENLETGAFVPPMAPLAVDFATRKATVVKNVRVVEDAADNVTTIKISKKALAFVGMIVGTGTKGATVSAIDKTNSAYDELKLSAALGEAVTDGQVLFEASSTAGTGVKNKANFLNYAFTKVEVGATIDAVGRAFEIRESKLYAPVSEKDKETLKGFFIFTL